MLLTSVEWDRRQLRVQKFCSSIVVDLVVHPATVPTRNRVGFENFVRCGSLFSEPTRRFLRSRLLRVSGKFSASVSG